MRTLAATLITFGSLAGGANAAVLLTVDTTDPSAVVITATAGLASQTGSSGSTGFDLRGFYTGTPAESFSAATFSSLVTPENGTTFDNYFNSSTTLNIFLFSAGPEFTAGNIAFSGSATFDLSAHAAFLPAAGASGNITFYLVSTPIFGEWQVSAIPEPSSAFLLGLGVLGVAVRRRRIN